jgi:hypothetical protein
MNLPYFAGGKMEARFGHYGPLSDCCSMAQGSELEGQFS